MPALVRRVPEKRADNAGRGRESAGSRVLHVSEFRISRVISEPGSRGQRQEACVYTVLPSRSISPSTVQVGRSDTVDVVRSSPAPTGMWLRARAAASIRARNVHGNRSVRQAQDQGWRRGNRPFEIGTALDGFVQCFDGIRIESHGRKNRALDVGDR